MYLFGILIALIVGGVFALLVRTELFAPGKTIVAQDTYNQFFTLHGAVMVFLVIIPGIPAALGNIIMPIQLGAPDVAFPRLNLASFYLWVLGRAAARRSRSRSAASTPAGRSTRRTALESKTPVLIAGLRRVPPRVLVDLHRPQLPRHDPQVPPAGHGLVPACRSTSGRSTRPRSSRCSRRRSSASRCCCSSVERFAHIGIFDPTLGGDPVLFQHFFWFYSHPAVYIMIIPGMGVISELITTFSRKPIFGYRFVAYSSVSLALLSFLVWGHHMFVSGQSRAREHGVLGADVHRRHPVGDQGLQLGRDALQGRHPAQDADALRAVVPAAVHDRRPDRPVPRHAVGRRPPARHVLRRRPLPLRDDGLDARRVPRRRSTTGGRSSPAGCTTRRSARSARSACSSAST